MKIIRESCQHCNYLAGPGYIWNIAWKWPFFWRAFRLCNMCYDAWYNNNKWYFKARKGIFK